jgi:hypothetical protein
MTAKQGFILRGRDGVSWRIKGQNPMATASVNPSNAAGKRRA